MISFFLWLRKLFLLYLSGNGMATGNEKGRKNGESTADFAMVLYFVSVHCM